MDILEENPYAAAVNSNRLSSACSRCFVQKDHVPVSRCMKCKAIYYCSSACQKGDWKIHKKECEWLSAIHPFTPNQAVRLIARLLIRRKKGDSSKVTAFNG
ncbi:hypothetical protein PFISCL1PPCAC_24350, partial [Pristionchus fissidentatus]